MATALYARIQSRRDVAVMQAMTAMLQMDRGEPAVALRLMWTALEFFESRQLTADVQVARNFLRQFRGRLGDEFEAVWRDAVGQEVPAWLRAVPVSLPPELLEVIESLRAMSQDKMMAYFEEHPETLQKLIDLGIVGRGEETE